MFPGDIVRLCHPYKPAHFSSRHSQQIFARLHPGRNPFALTGAWNSWVGFSHGIIVEVIDQDTLGRTSTLAVHLFDPQLGLLYMADWHPQHPPMPVYVDFGVDEIELCRSAQSDLAS